MPVSRRIITLLAIKASYRNKFSVDYARRAPPHRQSGKLTLCSVRQLQLFGLQADYPCNSFSAGNILRVEADASFPSLFAPIRRVNEPGTFNPAFIKASKFVTLAARRDKASRFSRVSRWKILAIVANKRPTNAAIIPPPRFPMKYQKACSFPSDR